MLIKYFTLARIRYVVWKKDFGNLNLLKSWAMYYGRASISCCVTSSKRFEIQSTNIEWKSTDQCDNHFSAFWLWWKCSICSLSIWDWRRRSTLSYSNPTVAHSSLHYENSSTSTWQCSRGLGVFFLSLAYLHMDASGKPTLKMTSCHILPSCTEKVYIITSRSSQCDLHIISSFCFKLRRSLIPGIGYTDSRYITI